MRVCLMIEGQENVTWAQWQALARTAEEQGFDVMFRSDHYSSLRGRDTDGSMDAWTTLAALAAITERIHLGTLVSPVTFRHPSVLAKSVVTADRISGGRIEFGMGAGWHEGEHRQWGFAFPPVGERVGMLEEQVEIVHRLMSKDEPRVSFDGRHYRLEDCPALPKPVADPHPRLLVGGDGGPRVARIAARWADEYNMHSISPERCAEVRARLDDACRAEGRDPETLPLSLMVGFAIGEDATDAADRATRLLAHRGTPPGDDPVETLSAYSIAGTPDRALEQLAAFAKVGVKRVMLQHLLHEDLDALRVIGRHIIPAADAL
jgi:F420-dependent oxidoreductase-like protein